LAISAPVFLPHHLKYFSVQQLKIDESFC